MRADYKDALNSVGMDEYIGVMEDNGIDTDVFYGLTDKDLITLGITKLGHRKKILQLIGSKEKPEKRDVSKKIKKKDKEKSDIGGCLYVVGVMILGVVGVAVVMQMDPLGAWGVKEKARSNGGGQQIISPYQAHQIIKGCCQGAGGTFSPQGQDCVMYENQSAYTGCVGSLQVKFESGNVRTVRGRYRP